MPRERVANWGNFPTVEANVTELSDVSQIRDYIRSQESVIARGNGRCYGDSSLNEEIFSTLKLNRVISFDKVAGMIESEAGVQLAEILDLIVPEGFFLAVTPGTKFVTLGGAIAADVHGKNHHREGSFAGCVLSFSLLRADGSIVSCSRDENADLFWQTCGGMGLTGIILKATIKLKKIETSFIKEISLKAADIEQVMRLFDESSASTYSVAWLDCFAAGRSTGRSILKLGEHVERHGLPKKLVGTPLKPAPEKAFTLPFFLPAFSLNYVTVRAFNLLYYHKQPGQRSESILHFDSYFYPLDGIHKWNRMYGRNGLIQYQFVIPRENSLSGLVRILEKIRRSGQGSPLAVLKLFGKSDPASVMSFPMEGYTLALDFKVCPQVFRLLEELDTIVSENNGRIYLAKDARMSASMFHRTYSKIVTSGIFQSLQSRRLKN